MPRQRNLRNNNRREPYGRNYRERQGHDYAEGFAEGFSRGFAQGLAQGLAQNNAQQQAQHQADDHNRTLSGANIVPLGPRDRTRNRSVGTQTSRSVQIISGGNRLTVGLNGADNNIHRPRTADCRRWGMSIRALETNPETGSFGPQVTLPIARVVRVEELEEEEQMLEDLEPPTKKCGGCGSSTHNLAECLRCNDEGLMKGCPRCNTLLHGANDCSLLDGLPLREVVSDLLHGRANMPPFNGKP
ncbi:hypothetical protein AUP68_02601 [Ilyonectria robusta]